MTARLTHAAVNSFTAIYHAEVQHHDGVFECVAEGWTALGTLSVDSVLGNELKLFLATEEQLQQVSSISGRETLELKSRTAWLTGTLTSGKVVTLPDAFSTARRYAPGLLPSTVTWCCPRVLLGDVAFTSEPFPFDAVHLQYKWLKSWLTPSALEDSSWLGHLSVNPPPIPVFAIVNEDDAFNLAVTQTGIIDTLKDEHTFRESATFTVIPDQQRPLAWFESKERSLWLFMGLITGIESETLEWKGVIRAALTGVRSGEDTLSEDAYQWSSDISIDRRQEIHSLYDVFANHEVKLERRQLHFSGPEEPTPLLTTQATSPELSVVLGHWFGDKEFFESLTALLHAATREDDYYVESRLVNLAQALEALHTKSNPQLTRYLAKADLKLLKEIMVSHWPEEVSPEYQSQFVNSLPNHFSFRARLIQLFEEAVDVIKAFSDFETAEALARVVEGYRNAISHGYFSAGADPRPVAALSKLLSIVLRFHLLKKLGWSETSLLQLLKQFPPYERLFVYSANLTLK